MKKGREKRLPALVIHHGPWQCTREQFMLTMPPRSPVDPRSNAGKRLSALREPAAPADGAAFAELQEAAAIRTFGAKAQMVVVVTLGAIG